MFFISVVFIPLFPPPPPFQPENILLTARKEQEKQSLQVSLWEGELLQVPPAPPGHKTQPGMGEEGESPSHKGSGTPSPPGEGGFGRGAPKLAGDPSSNRASGQRGLLGQLWLDLGGFSLQGGIGIFWSEGEMLGKDPATPCVPPWLLGGEREDGGFGVPRAGAEGRKEDFGTLRGEG